jgi:hypothetical protein
VEMTTHISASFNILRLINFSRLQVVSIQAIASIQAQPRVYLFSRLRAALPKKAILTTDGH